MIPMKATLFTAGVLALMFLVLSIRVVRVRGSAKISLGDGGDQTLLSRIRTHANFAEYVPLLLILLALIEYVGGTTTPVKAIGAVIIVTRIAHALGMANHNAPVLRVIGAAGTFTLLAVLGIWTIWLAF